MNAGGGAPARQLSNLSRATMPVREIDMNQLDQRFGVPGAIGGQLSAEAAGERVTAFLRTVYGLMAVGLTITATVAFFVASSPDLVMAIARNRVLFWGIIIAQFGLVITLSARVHKLAPGLAGALFLGYSALTGVTMAFVLLAYTGESVASTFFVTAGAFGSLAVYGTVTSRSLAGWGQFLFMGLIGVVIASVVGIFFQSDALQFVLAFCGVIVFTGLTAYDAQNLKALALAAPEGQTGSYAVVGALKLYLDFVNLFLMLLRLFGGRRR
jgi:FtsH-binding integral membrane protein